ncbi:MAG TPA: aminotransferase class I/II-fold pyridoxal phosphate-dependent enzyme [Minicystis sp.]|nr:aminotransferase class I/II-fold pyridoxal phosphate-dependent enzyme [Minicystis sp.]
MNDSAEFALRRAPHLADVKYEIRGPPAARALELERAGHEIVKLNIGNPAQFGFHMPEALRRAIADHLADADGYTHQKGLLLAREAIAVAARARGVQGVGAEQVFVGNGVSELILMCLEALCEPGDEVLVPAPDYPLWTAAVTLTGARAIHYPCRPENDFVPDPEEVARLVTPRTRALVVIDPNNPTGAVYPPGIVGGLVELAERARLVLFVDEIYDRILYDGAVHTKAAPRCHDTLCVTFNGLSKVHRACGVRTGWVVMSGRVAEARDYLDGLEVLASLRLCANVPGQWAVPVALAADDSIVELTAESGRLGRQRRALLEGVTRSPFLRVVPPRGALYAFVGVDRAKVPGFSDARFAMDLLEREHVLVVPGSGFHVPYDDHVRLTLLPDEATMRDVFARIDRLLATYRP